MRGVMSDDEARRPRITVCVFAWNEVATVADVVREAVSALENIGVPFEVVVIDDGSTDGTSDMADKLASELGDVRVVHHGENRGLGGVYRTGFDEAKGTFLTFFPADGQFPMTIIGQFYALMDDLDLCLGYLP